MEQKFREILVLIPSKVTHFNDNSDDDNNDNNSNNMILLLLLPFSQVQNAKWNASAASGDWGGGESWGGLLLLLLLTLLVVLVLAFALALVLL